jgi:ATP-dependent DNA helicase RecG
MKETPKISARVMSEKIGISQRAVEKTIRKLKKEGVIKRVGSPKNGYWKVLG